LAFLKNLRTSQVWWCIPVIPEPGRQSLETLSLRPVGYMQVQGQLGLYSEILTLKKKKKGKGVWELGISGNKFKTLSSILSSTQKKKKIQKHTKLRTSWYVE
jgi:hypothetical protein